MNCQQKHHPSGGLTAVVIVMVTDPIDEGADLMQSRFLSTIMRISPAVAVKLNG